MIITKSLISNSNKYDKEREYVRENVQAQREQHKR